MKFMTTSFLILIPFLAGAGSLFCMSESDNAVVTSGDREEQGWIGVSIQDMTSRLAESMKSETREGALVNEVIGDSPAEKAGIKPEDIIVSFNGSKIEDSGDLMREVRAVKPDETAEVVLIRNNKRETVRVIVGDRPHRYRAFSVAPDVHWQPRVHAFHGSGALGLSLQDLSPQLAGYFGAPENQGVLVTEVEEEGPAAKAGFKAGDVILNVENQAIRESDDVWDEVEEYEKGDKVSFEILRDKSRNTLTMEVEEAGHRFWFRGPNGGTFDFDHEFEYEFDVEEPENLEDQLKEQMEEARPQLERLKFHMKELQREMREWNQDLQDKIRMKLREARI